MLEQHTRYRLNSLDCGPHVPLALNAYLGNYEGILRNHPNCAGVDANARNIMLVSRYTGEHIEILCRHGRNFNFIINEIKDNIPHNVIILKYSFFIKIFVFYTRVI